MRTKLHTLLLHAVYGLKKALIFINRHGHYDRYDYWHYADQRGHYSTASYQYLSTESDRITNPESMFEQEYSALSFLIINERSVPKKTADTSTWKIQDEFTSALCSDAIHRITHLEWYSHGNVPFFSKTSFQHVCLAARSWLLNKCWITSMFDVCSRFSLRVFHSFSVDERRESEVVYTLGALINRNTLKLISSLKRTAARFVRGWETKPRERWRYLWHLTRTKWTEGKKVHSLILILWQTEKKVSI